MASSVLIDTISKRNKKQLVVGFTFLWFYGFMKFTTCTISLIITIQVFNLTSPTHIFYFDEFNFQSDWFWPNIQCSELMFIGLTYLDFSTSLHLIAKKTKHQMNRWNVNIFENFKNAYAVRLIHLIAHFGNR